MKTQKKLFVFAVLLMAASLVFAQTSMTSYSTQGLFGTDVDDFMNVNEWQNVQPKNIFGFLGYNTVDPDKSITDATQKVGDGALNLGLAHQFKAFYLGTYFEGQLNGWKNTPSGSESLPLNPPPAVTPVDTPLHKANSKLLFGFGNIGIMTDISYQPKMGNKTELAGDTKTIYDKFILDVNLIAGMNLNANNKLFKISPYLKLKSNLDNKTEKKNGKLDTFNANNSEYTLSIGSGFSHDLSSKDGLTHTVMADLDTIWKIHPVKTQVTSGGTSVDYEYGALGTLNTVLSPGIKKDSGIIITPKYQIAYEPEGKFAFKAEADLGIGLYLAKDWDYKQETISGVKQSKRYNPSRQHDTTLSLKPELKAAFVYTPVSKFKLNFGLGFECPSVDWAFTKTETRNPNTGKVTGTSKNNVLTFNTNDGKFSASSGFTWLITENVTLDANWNILNTLIGNDFSTDLDSTGSFNAFWGNINKLVFHKIGFALSVKF